MIKRLLFFVPLLFAAFYVFQFPPSFLKKAPSSIDLLSQEWARNQIREDLTPFLETGIKKSNIYATMRKIPPKEGFLHVKIQSGAASFSSDDYIPAGARSKHMKKFFKSLAKQYQLPDVEFVICLMDAYDDQEELPVPVFVFAKRDSSARNVLIPDFEALDPNKRLAQYKKAAADHPWKEKKDVVFWRGATTGGMYEIDNYLQFPRVKLVLLSKQHPEWLDAAFTLLCQGPPAVFKKILEQSRPLAPSVKIPDHFAFKYLIDIDGNSCTYERCRWILLSNSTLLKPFSHNIQWYYKALQPYVHYLPLKEDLSDLQGAYEWLKTHDAEAQRIADEGRNLGLSIFSKQAIEEYFATLIYEYSRLYRKAE